MIMEKVEIDIRHILCVCTCEANITSLRFRTNVNHCTFVSLQENVRNKLERFRSYCYDLLVWTIVGWKTWPKPFKGKCSTPCKDITILRRRRGLKDDRDEPTRRCTKGCLA